MAEALLTLPGGAPSHDTYRRVISALDPVELEKGFAAWVGSIAQLTSGEVVAIDGKALCGARARQRHASASSPRTGYWRTASGNPNM